MNEFLERTLWLPFGKNLSLLKQFACLLVCNKATTGLTPLGSHQLTPIQHYWNALRLVSWWTTTLERERKTCKKMVRISFTSFDHLSFTTNLPPTSRLYFHPAQAQEKLEPHEAVGSAATVFFWQRCVHIPYQISIQNLVTWQAGDDEKDGRWMTAWLFIAYSQSFKNKWCTAV